MATWNGARALGRTDLGRFAKGSRPGVIAIDAEVPVATDGAAFLLASLRLPRRILASRAPAAGAGAGAANALAATAPAATATAASTATEDRS